jgi:hypothetical protein
MQDVSQDFFDDAGSVDEAEDQFVGDIGID